MADIYANGGTTTSTTNSTSTGTNSGGPQPRRAYSRRAKVATAILGCAVIAGGAFAVTEGLSGGHSDPAATTAASGPTGQAAVLSDALSTASSTPSSTSSGTANATQTKAETLRARRLLALIRRLGGQYGQFTYGTKTGPRTLAYERGSIVSVSGDDVTVRAKDGNTWTWVLVSESVVRENGKRTESSDLAAGQSVFVGGEFVGTAHDAKLVVIR
jgi:hypothetical protein